jgi:lysophospholipase L1-like esterase
MPALLLLGDSHLARIAGPRLEELQRRTGHQVVNRAVGGATATDLLPQVTAATSAAPGAPPPGTTATAGPAAGAPADGSPELPSRVVLSVGTNDAAPPQRLPLPDFGRALVAALDALERVAPAAEVIHLAAPGIDEGLLGDDDLTNADVRLYVEAAREVVEARGGRVVDTAADLARTPGAFEADGVHLSDAGYTVLLDHLVRAVR